MQVLTLPYHLVSKLQCESTVCDNITYHFILFRFRLYGKVESFKRTICFFCLFNCVLAERRKNDCIVKKWLCGLHILLGALYKRVALGRIPCFCLSQAARDVQQVQETTTSSLRMNGLQATDYLPHVTRGGLDSYLNGDTQVSTEAQGDE